MAFFDALFHPLVCQSWGAVQDHACGRIYVRLVYEDRVYDHSAEQSIVFNANG
jgi:hypothetical protein